MLPNYVYSPYIKLYNVKVICSFLSGNSFNTWGLHQLFLQSSFLSDMPPFLRHGPCCLTPKCVILVTCGYIRANVNHPRSPRLLRLSESLSSPVTLLSHAPGSSHCQCAFRAVMKIPKSFWLSTCHFHEHFTSNIPSSARLPPQMSVFWDLMSNESKSHCNALLALLWAGDVC